MPPLIHWALAGFACTTMLGCYERFAPPRQVDTEEAASRAMLVTGEGTRLVLHQDEDDEIVYRSVKEPGQGWARARFGTGRWDSGEALADQDNLGTAYIYCALFDSGDSQTGLVRAQNDLQSWSAPMEIAGDETRWDHQLAQNPLSGALVAGSTLGGFPGKIEVQTSNDGGNTWSGYGTMDVEKADDYAYLEDLAYSDDGTLLMVERSYLEPKLWIRRSFNDGVSFTSTVLLDTDPDPEYWNYTHARLCHAGTQMHAVWSHKSGIEHAYSDDHGLTWSSKVTIMHDKHKIVDLITNSGGSPVVMSYLNDGNLCYREFLGDAWSDEFIASNHLSMTQSTAGMDFGPEDELHAAWSSAQWSWHSNYGNHDGHVAWAVSDPSDPDYIAAHWVAASVPKEVAPNEQVSLRFKVSNWTESDRSVDAWIHVVNERGLDRDYRVYSDISLAAGASHTDLWNVTVPGGAKGEFDVSIRTGDHDTDLYDEDIFRVEITP